MELGVLDDHAVVREEVDVEIDAVAVVERRDEVPRQTDPVVTVQGGLELVVREQVVVVARGQGVEIAALSIRLATALGWSCLNTPAACERAWAVRRPNMAIRYDGCFSTGRPLY